VRYAEDLRGGARVIDILDAAAALLVEARFGVIARPEAHGDTDYLVTGAHKQPGRDGRINTAAHGNNDPVTHLSNQCNSAPISTRKTSPISIIAIACHLKCSAGYDNAMTEERYDPSELARRIVDLLSDRQAEDVVLLDISQISSFTDYFVIASAQNSRHMNALLDAFDKDLARDGAKALRTEGDSNSGWVLVDFGQVIVHIFLPEDRGYYNLEGLWGRAGVPAVRFQ
jgi:ribosome-associated protein